MSQNQRHKPQVLRNMILFSLAETSIWTGRSKMSAEDYGLDSSKVPPEAVASLGTKRVIDAKALQPINNIRYKMRRACMEVGTRFLGGFAVSVEEADALTRKLDDLIVEGEALVEAFMASLDTKLQAWHEANPKWKHIFGSGTPERVAIAKKFSFGYIPIVVHAPENAKLAQNLMNEVDMLGANMIDEIVKEARLFVDTSLLEGRDRGSQKTMGPIRRLGKKIHSMRFIDPSLAPMAEVVKQVLATVPDTGKVESDAFLSITRLAHLLSQRGRFVETTRGLYDNSITVESVVQSIISNQTPLLNGDLVLETAADVPVETAVPTPVGTTADADVGLDPEVAEAVKSLRTEGAQVPVEPAKPAQARRFPRPLSL